MRWPRAWNRWPITLTLNHGTLYPALVRLEQRGWIKARSNGPITIARRSITASTKAGVRALRHQPDGWSRLASLVDKLLLQES
jgi:PadR family transcriptional regulator PadR